MQLVPSLVRVPAYVVAAGLAVAVVLLLWAGSALGRRAAGRGWQGDLGPLETMTSGLVGLLLAFNFSIAQTRYDARQEVLVREANAIGTAYLRCSVLEDADRTFCRERFRRYVALRIDAYDAFGKDDVPAVARDLEESDRIQKELWSRVSQRVRAAPTPGNTWLMLALNQVIDADAERRASLRIAVPQAVSFAIMFACLAWAALIGYQTGLKARTGKWASIVAALLISVIFGVALDFDRPRSGLITTGPAQRAMSSLQTSMETPPADEP